MKKNFKSLSLALLLGSSICTLKAATEIDGETLLRGASAIGYSRGLDRDEELARQRAETERYKRLYETLEAIAKRNKSREGDDRESSKAEIAHLKGLLEDLTKERDDLTKALEALASKRFEIKVAQRKLSEELERLKENEVLQRDLLLASERRLEAAAEALREEQASKAEAVQRLELDLAGQASMVENYRLRVVELEAQIQQEEASLKFVRDNYERLERGKKSVVDQLKSAKAELEVLRKSEHSKSERIDVLEARVEKLREQLSVRGNELSELLQTKERQEKAIQKFREAFDAFKDKIGSAEKVLTSMLVENRTLKEVELSLRGELDRIRETSRTEIAEKEEVLRILKSRVAEVVNEKEVLERTFEETLRAEREKSASELETIHAAVMSMVKPDEELASLREILDKERVARLKAEKELAQVRSEKTELLTRLAELGFETRRVEDSVEKDADLREGAKTTDTVVKMEPERERADSSGTDPLGNASDISSDESPQSPGSSVSSGAGRPRIPSIESLLGMPANPKRQTHFPSMVIPGLVYDLSDVKRGRDAANRLSVAEANDRLLEKYIQGSKRIHSNQRRTLNRILNTRFGNGKTVKETLDERIAAERKTKSLTTAA
jgi:chromosome segregation ATPase